MLPTISPPAFSIPILPTFKTIGLVGKPAYSQTPSGLKALIGVATWLTQQAHISCWVETNTALSFTNLTALDNISVSSPSIVYNTCDLQQLAQQVDAIVVVGGDGTMLGVARDLAAYHTPLIGINQGQLGFMTDISLQHFTDDLSTILQGKYTLESRSMIAGELWRDGQLIAKALALNDAVISRGTSASMVDVIVSIDGKTAYRLRADGLIVATPTGSTAYSLSANGPILHPAVEGFVIVPVAPQTLSNRSIVLPDSCVIDITLEPCRGTGSTASFDMQQWQTLQAGDVVRLRKSPLITTLVHPISYDYYHTLRHKLHWAYSHITPV